MLRIILDISLIPAIISFKFNSSLTKSKSKKSNWNEFSFYGHTLWTSEHSFNVIVYN